MPLTNTDRKYILNELLRNIYSISDKEYQKKVWIKQGPDFGELVNLLADILEPVLEEYKKFHILESQYQILKKFYKEFEELHDSFGDNYHGRDYYCYYYWDFIDSPEWEKIMNRAKEVLKAFNYQEKKD